MLNNNRKGRATTLSKTLLSAGLLGGAIFSTLSAGSAQAAWAPHSPNGFECTWGSTCGFSTTPAVPDPPIAGVPSERN